MTRLDCEVVTTSLGEVAVLDRTTGEVMHPIVGPRVESRALYVEPSRLAARLSAATRKAPLVVYDVGLGAGSNALAVWAAARSHRERGALAGVSFDRGLEAFRLAREAAHRERFGYDAELLAFAAELEGQGEARRPWGQWRLVLGELPGAFDAVGATLRANIVFWDPFSPKANPELWSVAAFAALRGLCATDATVHTYSSATAVRSALLLSGFAVGVGPATGAGRPTTIAALDPDALTEPLDRRWWERLARSSAPFPKDAPGDALERIAALPQFA